MGQYYKAIAIDGGNIKVYCPQNAVFMTKSGLAKIDYQDERSDEYWSLFSGLKLMEHAWSKNDFVNGVVESIWDSPKNVAWVGDYADEMGDFKNGYTQYTYKSVWGNDENESPFDEMPKVHMKGYLVNITKGEYIDLAKHYEQSCTDDGCHIHPLPLLTAIGNDRGGGDYHGTNMDKVGSWAMDLIMFTEFEPEGMSDLSGIAFVEGR